MLHKRKLVVVLIVCVVGFVYAVRPPVTSPQKSKIVFFDDFTGTKLDRNKWNAEVTGMHVNDELQAYVDSGAVIHVENGSLVLQPIFSPGFKTRDGQQFDFISGRLNTKGKFDFKYGTAEARIRCSDGKGLWPAWWMLGNGDWPETGETDIMEYVGEKNWASAAVHGPGYSGDKCFVQKAYFDNGTDITAWHIYAVDWTPDSMTFKYDGKPMFSVTRTMTAKVGKWAFDNNKYLILNFAVGGVYPANVNGIKGPYYGLAPATLEMIKKRESRMWVDWVRVTQK